MADDKNYGCMATTVAIAIALILLVLIFREGADGSTSLAVPFIIIIIIATVIMIIALAKGAKNIEKANTTIQGLKTQFSKALENTNFNSRNKAFYPLDFGLAINDNNQSIAVFFPGKGLVIYEKEKLISCENHVSNNEIIDSKTRMPIVSMAPTAKTKGVVTKSFLFSELIITVDNSIRPLIKLKFFSKDEAERYNALINAVIRNKVKSISNENQVTQSDKLLQLFEMYKQGLLTEEEFNKQKQSLLSS